MTKLKDKLSASVRQARTSTRPAAPAGVTGGGSPAPVAAQPAADKPAAARTVAPKPVAAKPAAVQTAQPPVRSGIAFPDRVWPD